MYRHSGLVLLLTFALAVPVAAQGADKPGAETASRVVDYYYSDATDPILLSFQLCAGVHDEGPNENNCTETLDPQSIEPGEPVYLWMKFLVPRDASATVLTQLDHKGLTRQTFSRDLGGALRYRTWHRATIDRTGEWEIKVFHEGQDEVTQLHSTVVEVGDAD